MGTAIDASVEGRSSQTFFDTSGPLLKTNAPDFDLDLFKELASIHGIGMCITTCIIAMLDCEENAAGPYWLAFTGQTCVQV